MFISDYIFWLQSIRKGSQHNNSRQDPGGRKSSRDYGVMLFTGLIPMASSVWFLTQPRTKKRHHPHWSGPSHITHQSKPLSKCPTDLPIDNLIETFSQFRFLFPHNSSFTMLTNTKHRHNDNFICVSFNCWDTKEKETEGDRKRETWQ